MNGADRLATDFRLALPAHLQATMPTKPGTGPAAQVRAEASASDGGQGPPPRLHHTTFSSSPRTQGALPRPSAPHDRFPTGQNPEAKPKAGGIQMVIGALFDHRWFIAGMLVAGGALGYLYTTQLCTPLYRIQASIELRNSKSESSTETTAHIAESQSLMLAALASMPEGERGRLVEKGRIPQFEGRDVNQRLRERMTAVPLPSAQVVDISLLSPNKQAGVDFLNALIRGLGQRTQETKLPVTPMPDELGSLAIQDATRTADSISVIDPAIASGEPVSPNLAGNILFGILGGAMAAAAFAVLRRLATNTFGGPGSVGGYLGVRELGAIPERRLLAAPGSAQSTADMQLDANDESLRYLRSSLLYHPGKQEVRCLAFTSAAPGEGKTTVVTNLSMSLASTGRRVLVIDGDLRRPRLHKLLQVAPSPGLSDLLRRDPAGPPAVLSKFVSPTAFKNLYVLPPGSGGNDVPELLAGPLLPKLIRDISKSFDFVLIDTPPLLACSDARNYARAVEGVVLVVRSSETQKSAALVARDMLLQDGATIIGTVLTGWRQAYPAYNYPSTTNYARS